jgi:hypothetical protein
MAGGASRWRVRSAADAVRAELMQVSAADDWTRLLMHLLLVFHRPASMGFKNV